MTMSILSHRRPTIQLEPGLPAGIREQVMARLAEYGAACRDEVRAKHTGHDTDAASARPLQCTYAAEIAALLRGDRL